MSLKGFALFALAIDGGVDEARSDGVDPYTDSRQVPGDGKRHAHDAALGGRVGGLSDLTVEGRSRSHIHYRTPLSVVVQRLSRRHGPGGPTEHVERANQVDPDHELEPS